jgi:hypothetical protein
MPGVRWAACEALANIGPAAQPAVPQLIEALNDEFLYVRIFAAGALGALTYVALAKTRTGKILPEFPLKEATTEHHVVEPA